MRRGVPVINLQLTFLPLAGLNTGLGLVTGTTLGASLQSTKLPRLVRPASTASRSSAATPELGKFGNFSVVGTDGEVVVTIECGVELTGFVTVWIVANKVVDCFVVDWIVVDCFVVDWIVVDWLVVA